MLIQRNRRKTKPKIINNYLQNDTEPGETKHTHLEQDLGLVFVSGGETLGGRDPVLRWGSSYVTPTKLV